MNIFTHPKFLVICKYEPDRFARYLPLCTASPFSPGVHTAPLSDRLISHILCHFLRIMGDHSLGWLRYPKFMKLRLPRLCSGQANFGCLVTNIAQLRAIKVLFFLFRHGTELILRSNFTIYLPFIFQTLNASLAKLKYTLKL